MSAAWRAGSLNSETLFPGESKGFFTKLELILEAILLVKSHHLCECRWFEAVAIEFLFEGF